MMDTWRDVALLLLLVHLMPPCQAFNVDGNSALKEILSKNLSIILIDDKADSLENTGFTNVTSLNPAYDTDNNDKVNDDTVLKAAMKKNVKILETELEEAIESAAISGQVILLSPPADRTNTAKPPLIIIENPAEFSRSTTVNKFINETIAEPTPKLDQEIAQSQNHLRIDHENYNENENTENLEDLLAIAEYEPQRIDARRNEEKNLQISSEQSDFDERALTIDPPAEKTHYDVPKQKIYPKNFHRISDADISTTSKPDLKVSSTGQVQLAAGPPKFDAFAIERKDAKVERRRFSSPPTFNPKLAVVPAKFSRDEVNSKVEIPSRVRSSIPGKFSYHLSRNANSLAAPVPIRVPGSLKNINAPSGNIRNVIGVSEPLNNNNVHSSQVTSARIPSLSPYRSDSIGADRRVDDSESPRYVDTSNREIRPLTNEQLGFLTRYNLPSLVTGKFAKPPVPSRNSRNGSTKESRGGENQNDERVTSETRIPRRWRTLISSSDPYEVNGGKHSDGKHVIDNPSSGRASNAITTSVYHPYEEVGEETARNNHRVDNTAYVRNGNRPPSSTTPDNDAYEISPSPKPVRSRPLPSTPPSPDVYVDYEDYSSAKSAKDSPRVFYEDYRESTNANIARNLLPREDYRKTENSESVRNPPIASREDNEEADNSKITGSPPAASHEDYRATENTGVFENSPIVSSTPVYDFYEDYEESDGRRPLPQSQRLTINDPQPPRRVQMNSYTVTIQPRPIEQSNQINLLNNPIYQIHGLKSTSIPVRGVYNPQVNYSTRSPLIVAPLEKQSTQAPRVTYTTPAYDSLGYVSQENRGSLSLPSIPNKNYVKNRVAKPFHNGNDEIIERKSVTPKNNHFEKFDREQGNTEYVVNPLNRIISLPEKAVTQIRGHPKDANGVSSLSRVQNSANEDYDESIEREAHGSDGGTAYTNPRASKGRRDQESHIRVASTTASPIFESQDNDDRVIVPSTSNRAKSIEPHSADYGNRIGSRTVAPSSSYAFATTSGRRGTERNVSPLNDDERSVGRKDVDEVPVETVNRASVSDDSDYEDEVPASSGHEEKHENYEKREEAKNGDGHEYEHEEGDGEKKKEDHHVSHGEKGEKGYKAWHEHDKGEKGYHDKESHDKEYDEKKGEKKKHEDESDYHKEHHHEEKGQKDAEFGEKGEHQKGHSTKGQHVVHKKDEYEKKTEFYDESHEEDDEEKEGGYGEEHEYEKGGHEKIGHHDSGHHEDKYGEKGEHEKGHHYHEHEGHKDTKGHDEHHHHEEKYGKKGGHEEGNEWSHAKGDNGGKSS